MEDFNSSLKVDQRTLQRDIKGSIAHVHMLVPMQFIDLRGKDKILRMQLLSILEDIDNGTLQIEGNSER